MQIPVGPVDHTAPANSSPAGASRRSHWCRAPAPGTAGAELLAHRLRRALERALFNAGSSSAARMAMIAITMSSSIRVNRGFFRIIIPFRRSTSSIFHLSADRFAANCRRHHLSFIRKSGFIFNIIKLISFYLLWHILHKMSIDKYKKNILLSEWMDLIL